MFNAGFSFKRGGGVVLQMVIISNWGLKIRLQVSGRLYIKALNLVSKFKLQLEAPIFF